MSVAVGLEQCARDPSLLAGARIGLVAHAASVNGRLEHAIDLLRSAGCRLKAVFGPQHGVWGQTQDDMIEWRSHVDARTNLPFYSLYGRHRRPTEDMMADVDTMVVDLQDVGARYYTFIQTLALVMEAAAGSGRRVVVLDRPNPINGAEVEGPVLDPEFRSFVGLYPLAIRHGLTIGEVARYLNTEFELGCDLQIVPLKNWRRSCFFDETGLPWVLPSPNIPTPETAIVYPGMCLLEGTNLSEGRGTARPFEICGAPWIDAQQLADRLNGLQLAGVRFRPLYFIPTFHKWAGRNIGGVQLHVTDRRCFRPFLTGLAVIAEMRRQDVSAFEWKPPPYEYEERLLPFDILCGTDRFRGLLETDAALEELSASWAEELAAFCGIRSRYLLYEPSGGEDH